MCANCWERQLSHLGSGEYLSTIKTYFVFFLIFLLLTQIKIPKSTSYAYVNSELNFSLKLFPMYPDSSPWTKFHLQVTINSLNQFDTLSHVVISVKIHGHIFHTGYELYFRLMFRREMIYSHVFNGKTAGKPNNFVGQAIWWYKIIYKFVLEGQTCPPVSSIL